ncbi:fumarylacetoacetate hydrolase family protein [Streptomyces ipomoeae]|jgi:2-keto-4-pentenoate hydratase/2-oxohepta-3-ene-1,7-dioic acid hydratase in catechol pathway|uniref:FAH family protein n=1 Tax=Streptomyces ipomoeae 91-03 TaxID=698759 RepID=L1KSW6_9ACTN|nr:fumarylacetoacetate hydrolase family protein [Streptomyces ipomoeae]EKX63644.1 FAH family protein [Streptomyces ipomoeae 91-03]MDX2695179.1 fumarylacetoacetate hydrolase family protein [Streptomyces ipomoeae]MDX2825178.1 fumarylacetoacetate hydrolase family protein [Streptomyces ipomoeae]MDX2841150.1 fumarylacetoacetate hydrolase family protein [Streptomyces ipomoeae]MDX2877770.1 fumarylacetoacetate hydrolase family protein [Streptomyces ipomoeae]
MKLANLAGRATIIVGDRALDVEKASNGALGPDPAVLYDLKNHDALRRLVKEANDADLAEYDEKLLGPVSPRAPKILAVALNYRGHAEESGIPVPDQPTAFGKFTSSLAGPYEPVIVPEGIDKCDFEAEVVVVIGKAMRAVDPAEVWEGVAGVTAGQDITDRREQWRKPLNQFTFAKSYDTFTPCGPLMATVDEFDDPDDIEIAGWVDDLEVQRGRTSDLIFSVPELVSWLSRYVTLEPGDLVFTGTPAGCGVRRVPRLYLEPGMTLTTELPGVGTMRNPISR